MSADNTTVIDQLLEEQRKLTAVERFAQRHAQHDLPEQARLYRDLLPTAEPARGQQYAFEVNLDQCSGCKACVTACHALNGLDEHETWRSVGLLHGGAAEHSFQRFVTTACHHCVDPACLNGCPVNAYEKDSATGIVRHLDDQCIGCQYCILKCPYEVPQYHEKKGIVRKCDLCSSRLAVGEAPACVQACPNEAIQITVVDQAAITALYREASIADDTHSGNAGSGEKEKTGKGDRIAPASLLLFSPANAFLPNSPDPAITLPTTRYKTRAKLPAHCESGDAQLLRPQPAHHSLVLMLVFSQLAVGMFCIDWLWAMLSPASVPGPMRTFHTNAAFVLGLLALTASVFHLGRPLLAWRAFIGLKRSWLSREIVVFGGFAFLAALDAFVAWMPAADIGRLRELLGLSVAASGLLGVFCSVMIYHDTRRDFWAWRPTAIRFFGTAMVLGPAASLLALSATTPFAGDRAWRISLCSLILVASVAKLLVELRLFAQLKTAALSPLKTSALLMAGPLQRATQMRFLCGVVGGVVLPLGWLTGEIFGARLDLFAPRLLVITMVVLLTVGELCERRLFFKAVAPPKMPGPPGS